MRAFRWTQASGLVDLGLMAGFTQVQSTAAAVSADGSVLVGDVMDASQNNRRSFRWTQSTGMVPLPTLGTGFQTRASGVSADGGVIVGTITNPIQQSSAIAWVNGELLSISGLLSAAGIDTTGWTLQAATSVSADGSVVAGYGLHNGVTSGWVAVIPSPGASVLLLIALAAPRRRSAHS